MSLNRTYTWIGEWVEIDGSELINYYWNDFNPTNPTIPSSWTTFEASNPTSSFDLDGFQPWHEVWCWVFNMTNNWTSSETVIVLAEFQRLSGSWRTSWSYRFNFSVAANDVYGWWLYFGIDDDEIWSWYSSYRIRWTRTWSWWDYWEETSYFTVSNMDIDSSLYPAWCLWVDWPHLCYTDWTHWDEWYIHKIAFDSGVYDYVGRDCAWSIWMENSGATAMQRLYYVTESWYKTRTYWCQLRYWWNVNVWSNKRWSIWVPTWDMEYWYWHLCYVTAAGQKLRVLNWPPSWVV